MKGKDFVSQREQGNTDVSSKNRFEEEIHLSREDAVVLVKRQIIRTYIEAQRNGCKITPSQVHQEIKRMIYLGELPDVRGFPSRSTVYRILRVVQQRSKRKSKQIAQKHLQISPPYRQEHVQFSNQMWCCYYFFLNSSSFVNCFGKSLSSLLVVVYEDVWSGNIMGFYLADQFTSLQESLALALRHAILPKQTFNSDASTWLAGGYPKSLLSYSREDFFCIADLGEELGIPSYFENQPLLTEGKIKLFDQALCNHISSLLNSREEQQPVNLTKQELEQVITYFIAGEYNQHSPQNKSYTRTQAWIAGLVQGMPEVPTERSLDFLLPRSGNRKVYRGGRIRFENWIYRDEVLNSHVGETVFVRYYPKNITTILVYQAAGSEEVLLARPLIQNFQEESLALHDSRAMHTNWREYKRDMKRRKSRD